MSESPERTWLDAVRAACLLAIDPGLLRGVLIRGASLSAQQRWIALFQALSGMSAPLHRLAPQVDCDQMQGGLDVLATLQQGSRVIHKGLLDRVSGGALVVPMVERIKDSVALVLGRELQIRAVPQAGPAGRSSFVVIAIDESDPLEPPVCNALTEQLSMVVDLSAVSLANCDEVDASPALIAESRARLAGVALGDGQVDVLCELARSFGVPGMSMPLHAMRVARAAAALSGFGRVGDDELAVATRLVLVQRARRRPEPQAESRADDEPLAAQASPRDESVPHEPAGDPSSGPAAEGDSPVEPVLDDQMPDDQTDMMVQAIRAAIPAVLFRVSADSARNGLAARHSGRFGSAARPAKRGRAAGVRPGRLGAGARLHLLETLRAALPMQRIRRESRRGCVGGTAPPPMSLVQIWPTDFRIRQFRQRPASLSIFVVDASGSSAMHRLGEVKGAIELSLAQSYVRRESVALIAFRGRQAQLLLPPTRSLARARRELSCLPGGGATPLASGLRLALGVIDNALRDGERPSLILLTDGRANVTLSGEGGRDSAMQEAMLMAGAVRKRCCRGIVVDTAIRPSEPVRLLAREMDATCVALPQADARSLDAVVRHHREHGER